MPWHRALTDGDQLGEPPVRDPSNLSLAVAFAARLEGGTAAGAGALALRAWGDVGHLDLGARALDRGEERQPYGDLEVAAPAHLASRAPPERRAEPSAEELLEDR